MVAVCGKSPFETAGSPPKYQFELNARKVAKLGQTCLMVKIGLQQSLGHTYSEQDAGP